MSAWSQFNDCQHQSFQLTTGVASNIHIDRLSSHRFSAARSSGTFVDAELEHTCILYSRSFSALLGLFSYRTLVFTIFLSFVGCVPRPDKAQFRDSVAQHRLGQVFFLIGTATETRVNILPTLLFVIYTPTRTRAGLLDCFLVCMFVFSTAINARLRLTA